MNCSQSISTCLNKYATFTGRASRSEYWWWTLAIFVLNWVLSIFAAFLGNAGMVFTYIVQAALFLPSLAVAMRRLHDTNRSGWWSLLCLVPIVGWIILIVWCCQPSASGPNRYGVPPVD